MTPTNDLLTRLRGLDFQITTEAADEITKLEAEVKLLQAEPLFEGSMEALHYWTERYMERTGLAGEQVIVQYAAPAPTVGP